MLTLTLIGLCEVAICRAREVNNCTNTYVRNNFKYEKEILKDGIEIAFKMAIDYNDNTIFFSYSTGYTSTDYASTVENWAYINLKLTESRIISGINEGCVNAVDNENNKVYLTGSNGIYIFDQESKTAQYFAANGSVINQMLYKEKLYFTTSDEKAFTLEDGVSKGIPQLVGTSAALVAVDKNNNLFFSNSSGLFKVVKEDFEFKGDYSVNCFSVDANGKLYFSTFDNVYVIDDRNDTIESIFSKTVKDIKFYDIAIDGDNIIVGVYEYRNDLGNFNIVKLKKTDQVYDE